MFKSKHKTKAFVFSSLIAASLLVAQNAVAQEQRRDDRQSTQTRMQQRGPSQADLRQDYDNALEDYLVVRLAEYSNLIPAVKVQVADGTATLSGRVPSEQAKQRAIRIVRSTRGISSVRDQIKVDTSMEKAIGELARNVNEKELAQHVARRIADKIEGAQAGEDWWLTGWRVEGPYNTWNFVVETEETGFVMLEGEVPSWDIMRKAVEAAASVPGVRRVDSDLELQQYFNDRYRGFGYRGPYDRYGDPYAFGYYPYYPPAGPDGWYPLGRPAEGQQ